MTRLLLALLLATPATAPPPPPPPAAPPRMQPARDVIVTYRVEGQAASIVPGGIPGPLKLSWDAAGQRIRAETEGRSQVALVDLRAHTGQAFDTSLRVTMPLPLRPADLQPLTLEGARLVPRGKEVIAGLNCNAYLVETGKAPGSVCLTPDGVPLRGRGDIDGKPGAFTAVSVTYGPLPSTLFTVPPGYIALGSGAGGLAGMAGRLGGMSGLGTMGDLRSLGSSLMGRGGQ